MEENVKSSYMEVARAMKTISKLQNSARKLAKLILTIQEDRVRQIYFNVIVDKIYIKNYRKFCFDRSFNLYGFVSPDRGMASDLFPFIFVVYSDTQFYPIIYNFLRFYIVIFNSFRCIDRHPFHVYIGQFDSLSLQPHKSVYRDGNYRRFILVI